MTSEDIATTIIVTVLPLVFLAIMSLIIFDGDDITGAFHRWKGRRVARRIHRQEKDLPAYERLARAHDRKADHYLAEGFPEYARDEMRRAQRIRTESTEAMMRGEEPPL